MSWRNRGKGHERVPEDSPLDSDERPLKSDKVKEVQMEIAASKYTVGKAIDKVIERGDKLDELDDKAEQMREQGEVFQRKAKVVQRKMWWANCKVKGLMAVIILIVLIIVYFTAIHPFVKDLASGPSDSSTAAPEAGTVVDLTPPPHAEPAVATSKPTGSPTKSPSTGSPTNTP